MSRMIDLNEVKMMQGPVLPQSVRQDSELPTFGTLFLGADTISDAFSSLNYVFRVEGSARLKDVRTRPLQFNRFERVPWKKIPNVDLLFVRQPKKWNLRSEWLDIWCVQRKVPTLVLLHHQDEAIGIDERSIGAFLKELESLDYLTRTFPLNAEDCGAATWSNYIVSIACLKHSDCLPQVMSIPLHPTFGLGIRSCRNLIRTYNIPSRLYFKDMTSLKDESHPVFSNFLGTFRKQPVFSMKGPFHGNNCKAFIHVDEKGFRTLQEEEWRELKQVSPQDKATIDVIAKSIEAHVFCALGYLLYPSEFLQDQPFPATPLHRPSPSPTSLREPEGFQLHGDRLIWM